MFGMFASNLGNVEAAAIGNLTTQSTGYNYSWSSTPINGMTSGYAQLDRIYADGLLNTCFDPATMTQPGGGYTSIPMVMDATKTKLARTAVANNIEGMDDQTYAAWQLYQHTIMYGSSHGFTVDSTDVPNPSSYFAQFEAKATSYWTKPTFNFGDGTIKSGETKTYSVTNGITSGWIVSHTSTGVTASFSGGVLTVVNNNTTDETLSVELRKEIGQYKRLSMVYNKAGSQQTGSFGISDPDYFAINFQNLRKGDLQIVKVDNLGNKVSGVTFQVSENADMSNPFATLTTGSDGTITQTGIDIGDVYVQETAVREPLTIDKTIHKVTILPNQTVVFTQTNNRVTGTAVLNKVDKDTGGTKPLGEATLDDAEFEFRALEDTYDKITGLQILKKDQLIKTEVIGSDLKMTVTGLQPARYYFIEKTESTGYLLDNEKHIVDLRYVDNATAVVTDTTTSYQEVKRGNIKIQKFVNTEGTGIKLPEPNVPFKIQLQAEYETMGAAAPVYATITTNLQGEAEAKDLPWAGIKGYRVTQVSAANENLEVAQPWISKIVNDGETMYYIVGNELHTSYLQVYKQDQASGELIVFPATFQIWDKTNNDWYTEVIGNKVIDKWTTEDGMLITNKTMPAGEYELVEVGTPSGYLDKDERIPFTITASNAHEVNVDGKPIFVVRVSNEAPTGSMKLTKVFERIEGLHNDETLASGWEVTYANDVIATYDGETVLHKAGEQYVNPDSEDGLWYANEDADLFMEDIYVGYGEGTTLNFDEVVYPQGYEPAKSFSETFVKDEDDNKTKVIEIEREVENKIIRTDLEVVKKNQYTDEIAIGEEFGWTIYVDEELTQEIAKLSTDPETGKAVLGNLPWGFEGYLVETSAPEGWYLSEEVIHIVINDETEGIGKTYSIDFYNQPKPTLGTQATGENGEKVFDPSVDNIVSDTNKLGNVDTSLTYDLYTVLHYSDTQEVIQTEIEKDITFTSHDTEWVAKMLIKAGTITREGDVYFSEYLYPHGYEIDPENPEEGAIVFHNDPEDPDQTINFEKFKYEIKVNKADKITDKAILGLPFSFEYECLKDGKVVDTFVIEGDVETGIATLTFYGEGTYDEIRIKEEEAPEGFVLSDEVVKVTMDDFDEDRVYTIKYYNEMMEVIQVHAGDSTNLDLHFTLLGLSGVFFIILGILINQRRERAVYTLESSANNSSIFQSFVQSHARSDKRKEKSSTVSNAAKVQTDVRRLVKE